jgi:UDP-3-O-[3-hydroxymyristoyl] glucosamine N-acyltransferase
MKFTLEQVANLIGGSVEGNKEDIVTTIEKIEVAKPGSITFLSNPKYESHLYDTQANAVIISDDFKPKEQVNATLIRVKDAYLGFTTLLEEYVRLTTQSKQGIEQPCFVGENTKTNDTIYIGAFAYIGANVKIGKNVKIHPHAYLGDNTTIGDHTIIHSGARIYAHTTIGNYCTIHANAVIGSDGFGFAPQEDGSYKTIPQVGNVIIDDLVSIGANAVVDCATIGSTIIGKGVKIDNLVQIAHNVEVGQNTVIVSQTGIAGSTKIGESCVIAGQVGIIGHLNIADKTFIAAQSGVSRDTKEGAELFGSPALDKINHIRSMAIVRNLPKVMKRIEKLEATILESSSTK